jgi:hypothetical protein
MSALHIFYDEIWINISDKLQFTSRFIHMTCLDSCQICSEYGFYVWWKGVFVKLVFWDLALGVWSRKNSIISPEIVLHEMVISEFQRRTRNLWEQSCAEIQFYSGMHHDRKLTTIPSRKLAKAYKESYEVKSLIQDHYARFC